MNLTANVILNTFSIIILIIVYFYDYQHSSLPSMKNKLFNIILFTTILLLIIDCLGRFDGNPNYMYYIVNSISNFILFAMNPILPSLWLLFLECYINQTDRLNKKLIVILSVINASNIIAVLISFYEGWFYYIDSNNFYHRGELFFIAPAISFILLIISTLYVFIKRKVIDKKEYKALLFFTFPPLFSTLLHALIYGYSFVLNGVVISILIIYLYIQNQTINLDYLTGIYNRKMFEVLINKRINSSSNKKDFAVIMIDLDNFKQINDTYGHKTGDHALQTVVRLLKSCILDRDCIARYGGDEFCIILDVSNNIMLEDVILKIKKSLRKYNDSNSSKIKLGFSMGYSVYDMYSKISAEEFINKIDKLMYINKNADKNLKHTC